MSPCEHQNRQLLEEVMAYHQWRQEATGFVHKQEEKTTRVERQAEEALRAVTRDGEWSDDDFAFLRSWVITALKQSTPIQFQVHLQQPNH